MGNKITAQNVIKENTTSLIKTHHSSDHTSHLKPQDVRLFLWWSRKEDSRCMFFYSKSSYRSAGTKKHQTLDGQGQVTTLRLQSHPQVSMRLTSQDTGHTSSRRSTLGQLPSGTRCGPWNAPVLGLAAGCWWSHIAKLASTGVCNVFPLTEGTCRAQSLCSDRAAPSVTQMGSSSAAALEHPWGTLCSP